MQIFLFCNPPKNNYKYPNFKEIKLSKAEHLMADKLVENGSAVKNKEKLFGIFDKHMQKEAKLKVKINHSLDDFLQSMYLKFFELLEELKNENNIIDKLCAKLNEFKPTKDERNLSYKTKSLNTSVGHKQNDKDKLTLESLIAEGDLPVAASTKNDEEMVPIREALDNAINNVELSDREKQILDMVKEGLSITQIAQKLNSSTTIIGYNYQECIAKIQQANGKLPQTFDSWAEDFIKTFHPKQSKKEIIDLLVNNPYLLPKDITNIKENINDLVKNKFKNKEFTEQKYLQSCLKQPELFCLSPETIKNNVKDLVAKFEKEGLTPEKYLQACLKQPALFALYPETVEEKVKGVIKIFAKEGLTPEKYLQACLKQPELFTLYPETVKKNVKGVIKIFAKEGLTPEKYLQACLKQPQLFYQSPDTIEKKISDLVAKFKDEGLTIKEYLIACLKLPSLFYYPPETIEEHIKAYKYALQQNGNNNKTTIEQILKRNLAYSTSLIYLQWIVRYQIKKQSTELFDLTETGIKPRLKEYFDKHPDAQFIITAPKGEMQENFIQTMQEFARKDLNKPDAFKFVLEK